MKKLTKSLLEKLAVGDLIYQYPFNSEETVEQFNPEDIQDLSPFIIRSISSTEVCLNRIDPGSTDLYNITLIYPIDKLLNGQFWLSVEFQEDDPS